MPGSRNSKVIREIMKKEIMKWREKSKRSEATLTVRMKHEDDYGTNGDSNLSLSHSVRTSNQGRQSRDDDTNWQQRRETTKNERSSMHDGSRIGINYARRFPKCFRSLHTLLGFSLCNSCQQCNCCSCTNLFNFWPVRELLVEIHTAKMVLWSVVVTHPVGYSGPPSAVNDPSARKWKKSWKSHVCGLIQRRQTTSFTVLSCRFVRRSCVDFHLNYNELHQESLHCHQLEEELDDWCQYWYFQNGTGLSCRSLDSWCRWCNVDNASLKLVRFFNGPDVLELLREIHQFLLYRKYSAYLIWWLKSFCASSSILIQTSSSWSCSSWDARNSGSFTKRWWIPSKPLLMHLFLKLWAIWWSLCSVVFPYRWPWGRPFSMT